MPIYFNVPTCISGGQSYSSGYIRRGARTQGFGHREAPMDISNGYMRSVGPSSYPQGIETDLTVLEYTYYSGFYISARKSRAKTPKLSSITLDLYTVGSKADLRQRTDAVLVRNCDQNRVQVLSGGGYSQNGERCFDNIFLRVRTPAIIAIQRYRSLKFFTRYDYFYLVTKDGIEEVVAYRGDSMNSLAGVSCNIEQDWEYI